MVKQEHHLDPEPTKAQACPFKRCVGKPTRLGLLKSPNGLEWWVYCKHCHGSGPIAHNEVEAVEFWNDRRPPEPLPIPRNPYGAKLLVIVVILALLTGCISASAEPERVTITIENKTTRPVYGWIATGIPFFSPTVSLEAGATREWWVYRDYVPGRIRLILLEKKESK